MTDAEMSEAVRRASYYLKIGSGCHGCRQLAGRYGGERCGPCLVALALLESQRQVETLTKERGLLEAGLNSTYRKTLTERDAATARAERAEQARLDAVAIAARLEAEDYRSMPKLFQRDRAVAATERARVVEAIAAWHDEAARIDGEHGNSGQEFAHALSADHIRSHNWAPPEEDSK